MLLKNGKPQWEVSGHLTCTTNNRAELIATIEGLSHVPDGTKLQAITDSQYLQKGASLWIDKWIKCDWITKFKGEHQPVKNVDLWKQIAMLKEKLNVTFIWVRGHNGDKWNEYCDLTARQRQKEDSTDAPLRRIFDSRILDYKKEMQAMGIKL